MTRCVGILVSGITLYLTASSKGGATVIDSVPYTISSPGQYSLESDLEYSKVGKGYIAIDVKANNVSVDLNGHSLSGPGPNSVTYGIAAHRGGANVVIRNGTISGFQQAIYSGSSQTRVENMALIGNYIGAFLFGGDCAVIDSFLIGVARGSDTGVTPMGIYFWGPNTVIKNNQVSNFEWGIVSTCPCAITHNFVANSGIGMYLDDAKRAYYQGNVVVNCTTAFSGGTPVGQENGGD